MNSIPIVEKPEDSSSEEEPKKSYQLEELDCYQPDTSREGLELAATAKKKRRTAEE